VYTQLVNNCSAGTLVPIIKKLASCDSVIYSDEWKAQDGLVDTGYRQHHGVKHGSDVFANGRAYVNGIENFWAIAKSRLVKCRGFSGQCFHRHLKETEFRFNHRQEKIYELLLHEFRKSPL
jgi:transposase-like protein